MMRRISYLLRSWLQESRGGFARSELCLTQIAIWCHGLNLCSASGASNCLDVWHRRSFCCSVAGFICTLNLLHVVVRAAACRHQSGICEATARLASTIVMLAQQIDLA
jgi:hypothetical protein